MSLVERANAELQNKKENEQKKKQKTTVTNAWKRSSGAGRLSGTSPPAPATPRTLEEYRKAWEKDKGRPHPGFHNPVTGEGGLYVPKEGGWTLEEVQALVKEVRDKRDEADTKKLEAAAQASQPGPLTAGQSLEEGREAEAKHRKENDQTKHEALKEKIQSSFADQMNSLGDE